MAYTLEQLKQSFPKYNVYFKFKKKDGSIRHALGTTNIANIPKKWHPQGVKVPAPTTLTYFDIPAYINNDPRGPWRSLIKDNFIDIVYVFK